MSDRPRRWWRNRLPELEGEATTAGLTSISPAKPVVCEPSAVIAPVIGAPLLSVNSGSCELPLDNDVTVEVADSELTVLLPPLLSTCRTVPEGLENCRFVPSAALSCDTAAPMPAEKSTPITGLVAFALDCGSEPPAPSATIVTVCWVLVPSV